VKRDLLALRGADDATWEVFADQLISDGDPRGELIKLHLELERRKGKVLERRVRELLASERSLSGPGAVLASLDGTWRRGFVHSARAPSLAALKVLLSSDSGALLDSLVLDNPRLPLGEQVELVGLSGHRALRSLRVRSDDGDTRYEDPIEISGVLALPSLSELSAVVRELRATTRRREPVSSVETLELSAHSIPLTSLARWTFTALTRLDLTALAMWTRLRGRSTLAWDAPAEFPLLVWPERFTTVEAVPKLTALSLRSFFVDEAALGALERLALEGVLRSIDLSACAVEGRRRFPSGVEVSWPR